MTIEALGVILISIILIAGAVFGLSKAISKQNISSTQQDLILIRMQTQQAFSGATDFTGLDNAVAIKMGITPKSMLKGSNLQNKWKGAVTLAANDANASFTIALDGVPEEECTQLAIFQTESWLTTSVNGVVVEKGGAIADAVGACSGSSNTLTYEAR